MVQVFEAPSKPEPAAEPDPALPLVRHKRRPEWGIGILAKEEEDRRRYQFEDGKLRIISEGYYKLLEPVEEEDIPADAIRSNLWEAVKANRSPDHEVLEPVCAFGEQVRLFEQLYPKGFQDPEWIADHRGEEGKAALKRHREPSVAALKEALDPTRAAQLLNEDRHGELAESVMDVLAGTDLVPISHVRSLRRLDEDETRAWIESVAKLVHSDEPFDGRFRAYLRTLEALLGGRPSWREATAIMALADPSEHVNVRRSAFRRQAGSIAPAGRYTRKPKVASYKSYRRVALGAKERLESSGHQPRDLLDVHDFVWTTLRKSALDHLG